MWSQVADESEYEDRVEVHGKLERVEMEAGEQGEDSVDAGDFVDEEGKGDELSCCA